MTGLARRIGVVWRLEAMQMLRPGSFVWSVGLAALPAVLLTGMRLLAAIEGPGDEVFAQPAVVDAMLYTMVTTVVCLLGLLLTATSAVQSELENRTWIYLAVRPQAKLAALLGKYLFAVTWVMGIAVVATAGGAVVLGGYVDVGIALRTILLSLLACLSYGALYLLIGVAFLRVGMVVAIAYTLLFELALGFIPAVVNEVTISYHLRSLFARGLPENALPSEVLEVLGDMSGSGVGHVAWIMAMGVVFLGGAIAMIRMRQAAALQPD